MKILGLHRGFTTNSSASSEWVDPKSMFKSGKFDKNGNFIPNPEYAPPGQRQDGKSTTTSLATATPDTARPNFLAENAIMILCFLAAVMGLFALERFIRRLIKKLRADSAD